MTTVLIIIAVIILIIVIYLSTLDGQYNIDRSLIINAPIQDTYNAVVDFKSWPEWSPWLLHEPQTSIIYSDNYQQENGYYSWDGKLVGAGKLTHIQFKPLKSIQQKIEFIRPFKSICSVSWTFKKIDQKTEVHWKMQGSMPFFFRFMTKMTISMINKDYDLGLNLLNGYLHNNNEHPVFNFSGTEQLEDFQYAFYPFKGFINEMKEYMENSFPKLIQKTAEFAPATALPLTIYHKADPQKMYFECDLAMPVNKPVTNDEIRTGKLSGGKYFKVECHGGYQFLELAWYKAYSHIRMLKLKMDKNRPSLEVYENDPNDVKSNNEIKTSLYLPVK